MRFAIGRKPIETDDLRASFTGSIHIAEEEWPDRGATVKLTEARGVVTGYAFKRDKDDGWIASITVKVQSGMLEVVPDPQMQLVDTSTGELLE